MAKGSETEIVIPGEGKFEAPSAEVVASNGHSPKVETTSQSAAPEPKGKATSTARPHRTQRAVNEDGTAKTVGTRQNGRGKSREQAQVGEVSPLHSAALSMDPKELKVQAQFYENLATVVDHYRLTGDVRAAFEQPGKKAALTQRELEERDRRNAETYALYNTPEARAGIAKAQLKMAQDKLLQAKAQHDALKPAQPKKGFFSRFRK